MTCLTSGTLITTLRGEKPVEQLAPGDRVVTRDNGLQTVRSVHRRDFDYAQLATAPDLQPLLIIAGAVSPGVPERDMLVSPCQRLLAISNSSPYGAQGGDSLIAAREIADGYVVRSCAAFGVRYVHICFDKDEVILANGAWVECYRAADRADGMPPSEQTKEWMNLFPELKEAVEKAVRLDGM